MTSLLTNNAATAALANLRTISGSLTKTSDQVSSGFRIAKASDDAGYWSIATTMRSDKGAISAVGDALRLGEAKVDTAYEGVSSVVDILSEFKSKLVTATESSVDKSKVQDELDALKQQIVSIADSASFNGENWLNTDIDDINNSTQNKGSVVSSFVRKNDGNVAVTSDDIDLSKISLFNSTGYGLLQTNNTIATSTGDQTSSPNIIDVQKSYYFSGPITFSSSDSISFDVVLQPGGSAGSTTVSTTITQADVTAALGTNTISDADGMMRVLAEVWSGNTAGLGEGASGQVQSDGSTLWYGFVIHDQNPANTSTADFHVTNVHSTLVGGATGGLSSAPYSTYRFNDDGSSTDPSSSSDGGPSTNLLDMDINANPGMVSQYIDDLEVMTQRVTTAASILGSQQQRINLQLDFANQLSDSISSGVGRLVDANMEEASTRLSALQTQQQLAVQSLSIANQAPQAMMSLFR